MYQAPLNTPNLVTIHSEMPDLAAMGSFMADPTVQATIHEAGVKGRPEVKMLHKHS